MLRLCRCNQVPNECEKKEYLNKTLSHIYLHVPILRRHGYITNPNHLRCSSVIANETPLAPLDDNVVVVSVELLPFCQEGSRNVEASVEDSLSIVCKVLARWCNLVVSLEGLLVKFIVEHGEKAWSGFVN